MTQTEERKFTHTPGPWRVVLVRQIKAETSYVADVRWQDLSGITEANAHLIAAAPLLLEACELALQPADDGGLTQVAYVSLRRAIAAARGEVSP